jgi:hypothetical protein
VISATPSSRARRAELREAALAAALGVLLFLVSYGLLHVSPIDERQIVDTGVYQRYGDAMLDGQVPYRDFEIEYPPAALPVFLLPSLAPEEHYRTAFEILVVVVLGLGIVCLVALSLSLLGASRARLFAGCALAGLAPLALGTVVLTRFDLWPAFLTAAAVAAALSSRERLALGILGLAAAAKIYPAVLLPVLLLYAWRRGGPRFALGGLGAFAAVVTVCLLPFAILAPEGLADAFTKQAGRPLQIESLGAAFLLAAHQLDAYLPTVVDSHGSQNLFGSLPDGLATVQTALQILAVAGIWLLFALGRRGPEQLVAASAGSVCAFVAFGKVLSPQFAIWLVPLVPLVGGGLGVAASGLLVLVLVLTQLWFPQRYWHLVALEAGPTWLLVARNVALVALTAVLAAATASGRERSRSW